MLRVSRYENRNIKGAKLEYRETGCMHACTGGFPFFVSWFRSFGKYFWVINVEDRAAYPRMANAPRLKEPLVFPP